MGNLGAGTGAVRRIFELRRSELVGWRIACGCALLSLFMLIMGLVRLQRTEHIWVLPGSGGVYAGPLERLDRSRAFFHETALAATVAALQWSAHGFDLPELQALYFTPRAAKRVAGVLETRADDLRARALSTKPLVQQLSDPVPDGTARLVEVRGLLISHGQFAGRPIYEEPSFTLNLRFVRNPDLGTAGAYPWVVDDVAARFQESR